MANASVIRQFLVSLGWDVDTAGMNRFAGAIAVQSEAVRELAEGLKEGASKVIGFVRNMADGLDSLYFTSVKTKASAANLEALRYAAEQTGIGFDAVKGNLQSLANFIQYKPGGESWLHQLGVEAKDADGKARDTADVFRDLAKAIANRPNKIGFLQFLGIDPQVFEAVTSGKFDRFFREQQEHAKNAGLDQNDAAAQANAFDTQVRRLSDQMKVWAERSLLPLLREALPYFTKFVDGLIDGIGSLIKWWNSLGDGTKTAIKWTLAIAAALAGLVVGFTILAPFITTAITLVEGLGSVLAALTSPIGLVVIALGGLAFALSHVDWDQAIDRGKRFLKWLYDDLKTGLEAAKGWIAETWDTFWKSQAGQNVKAIAQDVAQSKFVQAEALGAAIASDAVADAAGKIGGGAKKLANALDPRGIRNNNPGNIEYGAFARAQGATGVEMAGRFATFATAQEGLNAGGALLLKYASQGIDSVRAIISKYAPPGENNTASYIASVSKSLGVGADAHLNLNDPQVLAGIERAIVQIENGKNPYSAEMYDKAARSALAGSAPPVITQHITTTVTGTSDASGVAKAVAGSIDKGNGLLVRSLQGRAS